MCTARKNVKHKKGFKVGRLKNFLFLSKSCRLEALIMHKGGSNDEGLFNGEFTVGIDLFFKKVLGCLSRHN